MTSDELHTILRRAANTVSSEADYFPWRLEDVVEDAYGWASLGWVHCRRTHKAWDVWWHARTQASRLRAS